TATLPAPQETTEARYWGKHRKLQIRRLSRQYLRHHRGEHATLGRFWMNLFNAMMLLLVTILALSGTGAYIAYHFYEDIQTKYTPQLLTLRDLVPRDNLKIYDSNGIPLAQLTDQGIHTTVSLDKVPQDLINATIATEDKNFWTNSGIDILRILQSTLDDLHNGRVVEGGSTITQQLIKNLLVGNQTTIERKIQELILTQNVNSRYSKHDIMEMYLNTIYYGEQAYGIDAAAKVYF